MALIHPSGSLMFLLQFASHLVESRIEEDFKQHADPVSTGDETSDFAPAHAFRLHSARTV